MKGTECTTGRHDKYYAEDLPVLVRTEGITEKPSNSVKITPFFAFVSIIIQRKMHITCHAGKNRETGIFCRIGGDKGHEAHLWGLERYDT